MQYLPNTISYGIPSFLIHWKHDLTSHYQTIYRAITSPASRHNISLINIFLILPTLVNMSLVQIVIGGCKFTTMGTGAKFHFCVDNSDVAQDRISHCLSQITSTAFIFAHTVHIKPDGCPLAGWYIRCTRYGSVGQCGMGQG